MITAPSGFNLRLGLPTWTRWGSAAKSSGWSRRPSGLYSTSVWLANEHQARLTCAASTILTDSQANEVSAVPLDVKALSAWLAQKSGPVDLEEAEAKHSSDLAGLTPGILRKGGHRMVVPLFSGGELLGLLCVADRAGGQRLTPEDVELLKCVADQAAASLRNARMSRSLAQAKEVEAFQSVSAFVVHDLKNTASALSLMVQNMSAHFDKPGFREDAIRSVSKSVGHITDLVGRLNVLRQKLEAHKVGVRPQRVCRGSTGRAREARSAFR